MTILKRLVLVCASFFCVESFAQVSVQPYEQHIETFSTRKVFSEVVFDISFSITQHNFRITSRNKLSEGIQERGHEYFPNFEIIHLCNLELAREVLDIDPRYIIHMPCKITIREQGNTTFISVVKLPENHSDQRLATFAKNVNQQLVNIVNFAVSF
jgi:uncharacterized protein (DUF302 family)